MKFVPKYRTKKSWAELAWPDFYVGQVGFGPSCPDPNLGSRTILHGHAREVQNRSLQCARIQTMIEPNDRQLF